MLFKCYLCLSAVLSIVEAKDITSFGLITPLLIFGLLKMLIA
jgi:hypothetical protein